MSKHRITCEVAKDLIPIYIDGALSKESEELVREHVSGCKECQKMMESMKVDLGQWKDEDATLFQTVGKGFRKMYFVKAFIAVLIFLVVWVAASIYVIENYRPIWPKSSVEGLDANLDVVKINGDYYIHQTDLYAIGEVCILDYDYSETGVYNFYLGENGIQTIMPGTRAYNLNEQYQFLCKEDGVKQINYCKPDGTVIFTVWEEGEELTTLVREKMKD